MYPLASAVCASAATNASSITYHQRLTVRYCVSAGSGACGLLGRAARASAPKREKIGRDRLEIRLAAVRIDADDGIAAIGEVNLIEAGAFEAEGLRGARFAQRERPAAIGVDDFDASGCAGWRGCSAQLHERIHES